MKCVSVSKGKTCTWQCFSPLYKVSKVYLSVKRLVDVHSIVLALLDNHVPTFPDEACGRVGVDSATQKHSLLLIITATYITDGLVHGQYWCLKVCKETEEE